MVNRFPLRIAQRFNAGEMPPNARVPFRDDRTLLPSLAGLRHHLNTVFPALKHWAIIREKSAASIVAQASRPVLRSVVVKLLLTSRSDAARSCVPGLPHLEIGVDE